jgi:anionic cell wall polymer biosynthesis LytR-Cps2A-Psr (LCP) family protein
VVTKQVRLYVVLGAVAVVVLGTGIFVGVQLLSNRVNNSIQQADLFGTATATPTTPSSTTPPPGHDIKGPLNILLVGVDTRVAEKDWVPHADAVMIMHVSADLKSAYLTSLPRDLVVNIPAFGPAGFGGDRTKLTHAMSYGSKVPGSKTPNPVQGFQLVANTVSAYTGIQRFDAGMVLTFFGLIYLVDAIGGIDMHVDQQVVSIHIRPDGHHRTPCGGCAHGFSGPQATYNVGPQHFAGWQALDYARQRYIPGGDYTRGRHQRQIIKAMVSQALSRDFATNPSKVDDLLRGLAETVIFDGRGRKPTEFAYALRDLRADRLTLVGLPGGSAYSGGGYIGESLNGIQSSYFAAVRDDNVGPFLAANPGLVHGDAG